MNKIDIFTDVLMTHKPPAVHRVGNWDKKISQYFPE